MRFLAIGRTEILYDAARYLADETSHELVGVVTAPARPEALRGEDDFERLANERDVPFLCTTRFDDEVRDLIATSGAQAGVSVNWVSLIGPDDLDRFEYGILNAHAGDLPRYRGNAVTNWALLAGEQEIVLSVHLMTAELDAGAVLARGEIPVTDATTIADVNAELVRQAPALFERALGALEKDGLPQVTASGDGFRCYPRLPRDGCINWRQSASEIDRLVRSLTRPYTGAFTYYRDQDDVLRKLSVWETRVVADQTSDRAVPGHVVRNDHETGESWVACAQGGVLALVSVSHDDAPERQFAPGHEWRSIRMRLGLDVESEIYRIVRQLEGR